MQLLQGESGREEKIGGMVYDMSPSPHYRHGIVNGNIYSLIKNGLKDSLCLVFMENLDLCYRTAVLIRRKMMIMSFRILW